MKGGNDTQTTESAPWAELQPYLIGQDAVTQNDISASGGVTNQGGGTYLPTLSGDGDYTNQTMATGGVQTPQEAITGVLPEASRLYDAGAQSYFPDQTYADFTNPQVQGQQGALNFAQGGMMDAANSALGANQLMTSGDLLYADSNPYLQQNISDANSLIGRDFAENIVPNISRSAQGAGQYGSSREGIAQGIAGRGAAEAMTRNTNQMMNQAYGMGLNAMGTGVGQANRALAAGLSPYQAMQDVGGVQQAQNQLGINENMARHDFNQNAPWQNLSNYAGILSGNYMGSGGTSTVPVTGSNPIAGAIGGGLAGFGVAGPWGAGAGALAGLLS